jgi:hypothetical protein
MKGQVFVNTMLASALLVSIGSTIQAEDTDESIVEAERCISLTQLDRTDIIDDRNILFYMRGNTVYLNQLPNRCSGLRMADRFSYRPTINRLCTVDTITPLHYGGPGGLGMTGGVSCKLGYFKAITEDEILVLTEKDAPDPELQGEPAEIEPLDEDAPGEAAEIESVE